MKSLVFYSPKLYNSLSVGIAVLRLSQLKRQFTTCDIRNTVARWAGSSAGRTRRSQRRGRGFESLPVHFFAKKKWNGAHELLHARKGFERRSLVRVCRWQSEDGEPGSREFAVRRITCDRIPSGPFVSCSCLLKRISSISFTRCQIRDTRYEALCHMSYWQEGSGRKILKI